MFFIEEPAHDPSGVLSWMRSEPEPNVSVCRPLTPAPASGFTDEQTPHLKRLVRQLIQEEELDDYLVWFYTPMALPLAGELRPASVIYDCMDELSAFLGASPPLLDREEQLLEQADVVFTGGASLFRAKQNRHANVHCFPSSVDASHFAKANSVSEAADQVALPHPRLGYFGVIDERVDLGLLDAMSQAHPEWQMVMVGPVVKVDPAALPRRPNLHFLGMRHYAQLPKYLAGWDVCLLPFARNDATRFISPITTLEYMAAERPIVSTPITDVADPYSHIVRLGETHADFIAACEEALLGSESDRACRTARMREVLSMTSWDATAQAMERQIDKTLAPSSEAVAHSRKERILVIGAGPTGLSAAYHLGEDALLIEQNETVGGGYRSFEDRGFTFDHAGHIMFSNDPYVHEMYKMLLGDNVHWQDCEAWVYSKNVYTRYPFQGSLHGLPPDVIKECLSGAIEARFAPLKAPAANGAAQNGKPGKKNGAHGPNASQRPEPRNFDGKRKLCSVPLAEMETSWLGGRAPLPDLDEMIDGALQGAPKPMGPNARFGYPLRGGFQAITDGFLPYLKGELLLNTRMVGLSPSRRTVTLSDGQTLSYEYLISTMPLPLLVRMAGEEAPLEVRAAAEGLRSVSVRCVNLGIGREKLTGRHWIYYPEETVFHRIFMQGNASPYCNPPGGFGLTCEITYSPYKPLPCDGDALIRLCIEDCHRVGIFTPGDPVWTTNQVDIRHAYVVYDHARPANVKIIADWVAKQGIILEGRYSEWAYSDHAFLAGKKGANRVRELQRQGASTGFRSQESGFSGLAEGCVLTAES